MQHSLQWNTTNIQITRRNLKAGKQKDMHFNSVTCTCNGCSNNCEVISIVEGDIEPLAPGQEHKISDVKGNLIARWGGTCGRWDIG